MIRRTVKIQLVAFVGIFVLGILYAGFSLVGLDAIRRPYIVHVDLAASGGIFTGAEVTYRGVRVGVVGPMKLSGDGVVVDLKINRGERIPADGTTALVANKSAVGEQYVDLQPRSAGAPYLANGATIDRAHTRLPVEISKVLVDLDRLVSTIDKKNLALLVDELGAAFQNTGPSIDTLIRSGNDLTLAMQSVLPQTFQLIDEGKTVLDTARDTSAQFRSFANGLALLTDQLRISDPDVRRLLDNGVQAAQELNGLLEPNQQAIAVLVGDLVTVNRIGVARLAGTRQTLVALPELVKRAPLALQNGQLHNGLVVQTDPAPCTYAAEEHLPRDRQDRPADAKQQCDPVEGGKRTSCYAPPPSDEMERCGSAATVTPAKRAGPLVTGTGPLTVGADGAVATVGWEGGQRDLLGDDAWLALLLAPLQ
ncbi:MAG: phospholipid/cholesterol/gamma-HCH transport system substrate-binding protein [Frankiaceae bacterium]|nr:phospholipid/cholesterol/gamma-HCH transport system substrate-binding protein [Frankiaceae bacterium]